MKAKSSHTNSVNSDEIENEKGMLSSVPHLKRKCEVLDNSIKQSPLRRSDRVVKYLTSGSADSKSKFHRLQNSKRGRKRKSVKLLMESPKAILKEEVIAVKRKKMKAPTFKARFQRSQNPDFLTEVSDGDTKPESKHTVDDKCSGHDCDRRDDNVTKAGSRCSSLVSTPITMKEPTAFKTPMCFGGSRDASLSSESTGKCLNHKGSLRAMDTCGGCVSFSAARYANVTFLTGMGPTASSYSWNQYDDQFGTCHTCHKMRRVSYDFPEQDLCSCGLTVENHPDDAFALKALSNHGVSAAVASTVNGECRFGPLEMHFDAPLQTYENVCALCLTPGELLCCKGKGCKICYHCDCLDPPLPSAFPGAWYCSYCVKKKLSLGVHFVSDGVENILDAREVESNDKGIRQKQYLVKYLGLAHTHNHWIPERQLQYENPFLLSRFTEKSQMLRWNAEWTMPQQFLGRRSIRDNIFIASLTEIFVCNNEWLVKWCGLGYEHCTWELEKEPFFSSLLGQKLMKEYESRHQKPIPCLISKFQEYWVPVQMSNYQLELYCDALLSNRIGLCSSSRNDSIGALRDILLTAQKCCSHPYLLDTSILRQLMYEKRPTTELIDIGIAASGKLVWLEKMLEEVKSQGLQVLLLYEVIAGSRGAMGEILEDFLRCRFGQDSYEHVCGGVHLSEKQNAASRFNKKEPGKFVFLLENRACTSAIKLSNLDIIIIHDSDWNPANDVKSLQKISIDVKAKSIKIFRLYTSFTVEERSLVLAKEGLNVHFNFQSFSRIVSDALLAWGSSHLFEKLDEYHAYSNSSSGLDFSSEHSYLILNNVMKEFKAILSGSCQMFDSDHVISKVKFIVGSYVSHTPTIGESRASLWDGDCPHLFWKKLLDGKHPQWKHLKRDSTLKRKRIHRMDKFCCDTNNGEVGKTKKWKRMAGESSDLPSDEVKLDQHATQVDVSHGGCCDTNNGEVGKTKKWKRMACGSSDLASDEVKLGQRATQLDVSHGAPYVDPIVEACNASQKLWDDTMVDVDTSCSFSFPNSFAILEGTVQPEQKNLYSFLLGDLRGLCQTLKLPEDLFGMMGNFVEYLVNNHNINYDSPPIWHALLISICWIAASVTKTKVDKKDTFRRAKQFMNYQCTEEEAILVYTRMRSVKKKFLLWSKNPAENCLLSQDVNTKLPDIDSVTYSKIELAEDQILLEEKHVSKDDLDENQTNSLMWNVKEQHGDQMMKLNQKHQNEMQEILMMRDQEPVRMCRMKLLENTLADRMEHHFLNNVQLKELDAAHLAGLKKVRQSASHLLNHEELFIAGPGASSGPPSHSPQSENEIGRPELSASNVIFEFGGVPSLPMTPNCQNSGTSFNSGWDYVVISSPTKEVGIETVASDESNCELETTAIAKLAPVDEHHNESNGCNGNGIAISENVPVPCLQKLDSLPPKASRLVSNEDVDKGSNADSVKECTSASPVIMVTQKPQPDEPVDEALQSAFILHSDPVSSTLRDCEPFPESSSIPMNTPSAYGGVGPAEPGTQAAAAVGIDASQISHNDNVQSSSWSCTQSTSADPLQVELEKIRTEAGVLEKNYQNMLCKVNRDREKEIEDITTQIHNKYGLKIQENIAEFTSKWTELKKLQNIFLRNQNLADALTHKCHLRSTIQPGSGVPSSSARQPHHVSFSASWIRPGAAGSSVSPVQQMPYPSFQTRQPHGTPSASVSSQTLASVSVPVQHVSSRFSSSSTLAPRSLSANNGGNS